MSALDSLATSASHPRHAAAVPFAGVPGDARGQMSLWLLAAAGRLADWLAREDPDAAARHRFLDGYRAACEAVAPGLPVAAWPARLAIWERREPELPLARAARALGLGEAERLAFALAALAEEDGRFGALFAELQGGADPYPSVETTGRVLTGDGAALGAGWDLVAPLVAAGLLAEVGVDAPRARRGLAVPAAVWDLARGAASCALPAGARLSPAADAPPIDELAYPAEWRARLARLPALIAAGRARYVCLRHAPGADGEEVAAALARAMGLGLLVAGEAGGADGRTLGAVALLAGAAPFLRLEPGPGETVAPPALGGWRGAAILSIGHEGGLAAEAAGETVALDIPFPGPEHRARCWRAAWGAQPVEGFETIRDRFQLPLGFIRKAAAAAVGEAALAGRETIRPDDVRAAARRLGREQLDGLAEPLEARGSWNDLVAGPATLGQLAELAQRCAHRERLPPHLGTARGGDAGRGVRALFTGPSGSGKTLAARLLGSELGMDVYRVDLAAVVDKYVGEQEKRLQRLMSRAEALDVILLLDEGDGLMARRTEVRSANDRFANLETNFLLQRLESYEGIAVVTTNLPESIDPAFQRRMDVVVPFARPSAEERLRLWRLHLPAGHRVGEEELTRIAWRSPVTGGQIRNAVRHAASLALAEGAPLDAARLRRGLAREYQKAGAMAALDPGQPDRGRRDGGFAAFAAALAATTGAGR